MVSFRKKLRYKRRLTNGYMNNCVACLPELLTIGASVNQFIQTTLQHNVNWITTKLQWRAT